VIRNAYSVRSPYDKMITVGSKTVPSAILRDAVGPDMRRFCNDPLNVEFQKQLMFAPQNRVLRSEQGKSWLITDERLWKYCWEGSLSLSASELGSQDRILIMDARKMQITLATPYVRSAVSLGTNNNPGNNRHGTVASGATGQSFGSRNEYADFE